MLAKGIMTSGAMHETGRRDLTACQTVAWMISCVAPEKPSSSQREIAGAR